MSYVFCISVFVMALFLKFILIIILIKKRWCTRPTSIEGSRFCGPKYALKNFYVSLFVP